jgi:hypothetical protein
MLKYLTPDVHVFTLQICVIVVLPFLHLHLLIFISVYHHTEFALYYIWLITISDVECRYP